MAEIFNYSPDDVQVVVAGLLTIDGFIDGTFISIAKDKRPFQSITLPDGTTSRLYNNDQTYTVTITLHSASRSNDFMTKLWQLDEITQLGKFPLFIKDPSGSDLFFSATTWIEQLPVLAKSGSIDSRSWVLKSSSAVINIGGNGEPSGIINDLINIASSALPGIQGILNG
jgi:hypothetical protein